MAPIYKQYVLPGNFGSICYPSTMANIFTNWSGSRLNIFTLLMVCFGVSKADTEINPTDLRDSLPLGNSPHGEASDPIPPREKVTKVLCIEYGGYPPSLSTAQLLVVVESQGEKTTGWYKYKKIEKLRGMQKALKEFGPMWS
ncbi:unnamed protein product [Penicillium nalgiovense]|nr:unnamed protein product [Penicillium nalgiovense]